MTVVAVMTHDLLLYVRSLLPGPLIAYVIIVPTEIVNRSLCLGTFGLKKGFVSLGKLKTTGFGLEYRKDYNSQ